MSECRGFVSLVGVQCCYANPTSGVLIVAHVDDFLVYGGGAELRNLIKDLQRDFEVNGQIVGPDAEAGEVDTIRFLGRSIRYTESGLEWEGDEKHVTAFLSKLAAGPLKGVATPGIKSEDCAGVPDGLREDNHRECDDKDTYADASLYRGLTAFLNFMSQDRVYIFCQLRSRKINVESKDS